MFPTTNAAHFLQGHTGSSISRQPRGRAVFYHAALQGTGRARCRCMRGSNPPKASFPGAKGTCAKVPFHQTSFCASPAPPPSERACRKAIRMDSHPSGSSCSRAALKTSSPMYPYKRIKSSRACPACGAPTPVKSRKARARQATAHSYFSNPS